MNISLCVLLLAAADDGRSGFPSHEFSLAPHVVSSPHLAVHFGLVQPLLLHGFNAAIDLRYDRFIFSYSHGVALHFDLLPGALTPEEDAAGVTLFAPFSTGFGVGMLLIDELYVMADFKLHHIHAAVGDGEVASYTTVTIGAEIGWRFFIWDGFFVSPVLRYWPNVWDSAPDGGVLLSNGMRHEPISQGTSGFFGNLLVGYDFEL